MPEPITPAQAAPDTSRGQRLAVIGLLVNLGLAVVKLLSGLAGRSYALTADGVESMADMIGSAVIWGGLHIAAKPADREHPYGHGKAEALAALIVALMIAAAGAGIAIRSVSELTAPTPGHVPRPFTLWVLIATIAIKGVLFVVVRRAGKAAGGSALGVDAWHHIADAISSLAALVGIGLAVLAGYGKADDFAALVAAAIIILNAGLLVRSPVHDLMDKEPADVVDRARRIAQGIPGVARTEKMAARTSAGKVRIDMHLEVDPDMTVREAHAVSHRVKDAVMQAMPRVADVLVHIEPAGEAHSGPRPG